MSRNALRFTFPLLFLISVLFAACGGQNAATEAEVAEPSTVVAEEQPTVTLEPTVEPTDEPTPTPQVTNAVTVADQALGDDNTITVDEVEADVPGWIVIHADAEGAPGPVVGHAAVDAGANESVLVEIDPEAATETLYAMLHVDAGTVGEYEFPGDDVPATDAQGDVVTPVFQVTLPVTVNAVTVEDQVLGDENTVTVAAVSSAGPGWIVIHADADGSPGPVIGHAAVQAGDNENVAVEVDPAAATETLYAMLHVDAGAEGEYEFPGDDVPATDADGNVVTPAFEVELPAAENAVTVEDQTLGEDGSVTVPAVTSAGPGWMVIHADQDGAPGPVIGHAAVQAGDNEAVSVEIDTAAATDTLYAMLHVDAGAEGEYEFPGDDVPASDAEGNVVVSPFQVEGLPSSGDADAGEDGSAGGTAAVSIIDSQFSPRELTVSAGTTVVWSQNGSLAHTVTADNGAFDSGTLRSGGSFSFTFDAPGEYPYYCRFHGGPNGVGMSGVIVVAES